MTEFTLRNLRDGSLLAQRVGQAGTFLERGLGLLPRANVGTDEGIWITPCSSVHTMGMRATIDLFFLDCEDRVMRVVTNARPNRLLFACAKARSVVELGAGVARDVRIGDRLQLE